MRVTTSITEAMERPDKVRKLRLYFPKGNCDVAQADFTEQVAKMHAVEAIHLNWNPWRSVALEFSRLPKLREFAILNSELLDFPWEDWERPEQLDYLAIRSTDITEVRQAVQRFVNLKQLDLHNNGLTEVPKEIGNLKKIRRLNLMCNPLTSTCRDFLHNTFGDRVQISPLVDEREGTERSDQDRGNG